MRRACLVLVGICLVGLLSCAKRAFPPGGPEDTTPPHVVKLFPASGSVNVGLDSRIAIEFSERMNKRSVETGVVVSPALRWKKRYWDKNTYVMVPEHGLKPNTTYLVSVWGKARDAHGVRMASTFVGGFATAESLEAGVISGRIRWRSVTVEAAMVELFDADVELDEGFPKTEPIHVAFSGRDGLYEIPFVDPDRSYRLIAFTDDNFNLSYDPSEKVGCYPGTVDFEEGSNVKDVDVVLCTEGLSGFIAGTMDTALGFVVVGIDDSSLTYVAFPGEGRFEIGCVSPGRYLAKVFVDRNNNRKFDAADSTVAILADTVWVQPCATTNLEWESEGYGDSLHQDVGRRQ